MAAPVVFKNGFFAMSTSTSTGDAATTHFGNVIEVQMPLGWEELDDSVMGDEAKASYPGVQTGDAITVRFRQDFTTGSVDSKLWAIASNRAARNFKVRPVNAAVADDNPSYMWRGYIFSYPPLSGSHGAKLETTISVKIASGSYINRDTST
jgi:hypothetical protein